MSRMALWVMLAMLIARAAASEPIASPGATAPSPGIARAVLSSVAATAVPVAVFAAAPNMGTLTVAAFGVVLGPAFGYSDAGIGEKATPGVAVRLTGLLVGTNSFLRAFDSSSSSAHPGVALTCAGIVGASAVLDIALLPGRIHERHASPRATIRVDPRSPTAVLRLDIAF